MACRLPATDHRASAAERWSSGFGRRGVADRDPLGRPRHVLRHLQQRLDGRHRGNGQAQRRADGAGKSHEAGPRRPAHGRELGRAQMDSSQRRLVRMSSRFRDGHYQRVWAAQGAPANTVLIWIAQRQNLVHPTRPGRARLFDSRFMPLTKAERPETNTLRQLHQRGLPPQRHHLPGRALLHLGGTARLARIARPDKARHRRRAGIRAGSGPPLVRTSSGRRRCRSTDSATRTRPRGFSKMAPPLVPVYDP